MGNAIDDIAAERTRQIEEERWTPEHDDKHAEGQIALAAASYAAHPLLEMVPMFSHYEDRPGQVHKVRVSRYCPILWPWAGKWWKPKDRRRDLVRAGALIVAEIERLDRASKPKAAA